MDVKEATMIAAAQLATAFERNLNIIKLQTAGLTHDDSLLQPPCRGNCLNWVLGHVAVHRNKALEALGAEPVMGEAHARYDWESEPVTGEGPGVLRLEELVRMLDRSQTAIATALDRAASAGALLEEIQVGGRSMSIGERVFFLYFHETYHVGQTELLRQLAGKDDKVI
jgi:uncharacterized damage-inducible protein DinB